MTHYGIIIPAKLTEPYSVVSWEDRLLPVLYREIGQNLDSATVCRPNVLLPGGLRLWCVDDALLHDVPDYNDRAIALCRTVGYDVPALAGPVLFVGCPEGDDEAGLHPSIRRWIERGLQDITKEVGSSGGD